MPPQNPGNGTPGGSVADRAAEDTVFDNLGLSREELGMDQDGSGNEDLDDDRRFGKRRPWRRY